MPATGTSYGQLLLILEKKSSTLGFTFGFLYQGMHLAMSCNLHLEMFQARSIAIENQCGPFKVFFYFSLLLGHFPINFDELIGKLQKMDILTLRLSTHRFHGNLKNTIKTAQRGQGKKPCQARSLQRTHQLRSDATSPFV